MFQPKNGSVAFSLVALVLASPDAGAPLGSARARALAVAALEQVGKTTLYDPAYVKLAYPGGDVPIDRGVCTDVVVRAFRTLGLDLQRELHQDMTQHFSSYPHLWGLTRPDRNIDHRRVQNLRTWLSRRGHAVPVSARAEDYWPGDVVTVDVSGLAHIVVVAISWNAEGTRPLIVHNIGAGAQLEDRLFEFPITGHYRPL
jgi:uncharacterized protein YijF (DUF1287 family)